MTETSDDLMSSPLWIWGWILRTCRSRGGDGPPGKHLGIARPVAAGVAVPMAVAFVVHGDPPKDPGPASWPIGVLAHACPGGHLSRP